MFTFNKLQVQKIYNNINNLSQNINQSLSYLFLLLQAFHYSNDTSNFLIFPTI